MNGEEFMRSIVAALSEANNQPLRDALHEDVVWRSASKEDIFSFHGVHRGRSNVIVALSTVARDYSFHSIKEKKIVASGDVIWGLFDTYLSYDAKGRGIAPKPLQLDMAICWRIKDGKIVENYTFFDTAHLLIRQGKLQP